MVSNRTASGKLALILAVGCLALCLFVGRTAADEQSDPDPKPPTPAELQGYRAALEDPLDSVATAAQDIERAKIILARLPTLPKELAQRVIKLWMREPTPTGMQTLAANADLAALVRPHARALIELLGDEDPDVGDAAHALFKAQPELLDLPTETLADWLKSEGWENSGKRLGAIRAVTINPKLARQHARDLSKLLGDEDSDVRDAAQALIKTQPELLDLPAETLADWLNSEGWENSGKRLGAVRAATINPKLARPHARVLTELLGDENEQVRDAAHDLFKAQPELLDLPTETLADWLKSEGEENWGKQLGAIWAATLKPKLARTHARDLSELLGDEDPDVGDAAHALFKAQPELLDLPTETLADWLNSEGEVNSGKRLGAVRAATLDPKLARHHTRALSELLGYEGLDCEGSDYEGPNVADAAQALFAAQPELLDASLVAQGLLSSDPGHRWRILNLVHLLDAPNLSGLPPLLEACHRKIDHCGELRLAAHLMGGGRPDWESRLHWLGRPKPEKVKARLKKIRDNDQAARQTLAMFADTWEATKGFPETRKELAGRIRYVVDVHQDRWSTKDKPLLEKLKGDLRQAGVPTGDIDQAIAKLEVLD